MAAALAIPGVTPAESRLRATCLTPGSVTDLVDVGEKIGTGGFSVVRAGTVRATGERVAIKVILPSHYSTGPQRMAALHEAMVLRKLAALNSPHILRLHSAHEDRSPSTGQLRLSLCTELVEGGELFEEICALEHFSEASASRLICRIAETLRLVHAAGVVHRDLKPENVLLRSRSDVAEPVLADFGLSLMAGEQDCARDLVGTHAYMAPEIVTSKQYSAASDVWVLGVLAYILVGGYHPFNDDPSNVPGLLSAIVGCRFEFHEDAWGSASAAVKDFVSRLLVADPRARLDLDGVLRHPWLANHSAVPSTHLATGVGRMRAFNARRKVRSAVQAIIFGARHLALTRVAVGLEGTEFADVALARLRAAFNRVAVARKGAGAAAAPLAASAAPAPALSGGVGAVMAVAHATAAALASKSLDLPGFISVCREVGLEDERVARRLFAVFDLDDSGDVDWRELMTGAMALRNEESSVLVELAFNVFDEDGNGSISREELIQLLVCTGYKAPPASASLAAAAAGVAGGAGAGAVPLPAHAHAAAAGAAVSAAGADYGSAEHNANLALLNALFERMDTNRDGRISLDEFRAAVASDAAAKNTLLAPLRHFGSKARLVGGDAAGDGKTADAGEGKMSDG